MEGDLNLSHMLGGLRIANQPDDSPSPSPPLNPSPHTFSSSVESSSSHSQIYIPDLESLESNALGLQRSATGDSSTHSLPLNASSFHSSSTHTPSPSQQQQQQQQPCYTPSQPRSSYPPPSAPSSRHSCQFVPNYTSASSPFPPAASGGASVSSQRHSDYSRISREPSRASLTGPPGSAGSRPQPPPRERSNTERTFRQPQPAGPSPFHGRNGAAGGSPYDTENGIPESSDEWQEKGAAVLIREETDANGHTVTRVVKKGVKDFSFGRTLGEGSYSTVG